MRYIDAELAKETIRECIKTEAPMPRSCKMVRDIAINAVDLTPTADVVEVVRCKNCQHCLTDDNTMYCERATGLDQILPDDYCSCGERRTDDEG